MESLLFRYVRGAVNDDEIAEVKQWMDASAENRKVVEQLCVVDYASEALKCMRKANPYRSLSHVKQKIRKNKIHRIIVWTQRAAAVLFIPLVCVTVYFSQRQPELKRDEQYQPQPQPVEIASAPGLVSSVVLPDNTRVWLNAGSHIKYPTFFTGNTREVSVSGEVYFSVTEDREKPFLVNVNDVFNIKVTGTELNVEAYPLSNVFSVTLVEGSAQITSVVNTAKPLVTLQPGEQSVWDIRKNELEVHKVNTTTVTSWKDGKIIFKNTPITEIVATLEKRYNAQIILSPRLKNLKDYRFTGTFTNQQLIQILEHFKISSNIRYEIKGLDLNPDGSVNRTIVHLK